MIKIENRYEAELILYALKKEKRDLNIHIATKSDAKILQQIINRIEDIYYSLPEIQKLSN